MWWPILISSKGKHLLIQSTVVRTVVNPINFYLINLKINMIQWTNIISVNLLVYATFQRGLTIMKLFFFFSQVQKVKANFQKSQCVRRCHHPESFLHWALEILLMLTLSLKVCMHVSVENKSCWISTLCWSVINKTTAWSVFFKENKSISKECRSV